MGVLVRAPGEKVYYVSEDAVDAAGFVMTVHNVSTTGETIGYVKKVRQVPNTPTGIAAETTKDLNETAQTAKRIAMYIDGVADVLIHSTNTTWNHGSYLFAQNMGCVDVDATIETGTALGLLQALRALVGVSEEYQAATVGTGIFNKTRLRLQGGMG